MALPKLGLQATLLVRDFQRNARLYNRTLKDMTGQTKKTAQATKEASRQSSEYFSDFVQKVIEGGKLTEGAMRNMLGSLRDLPAVWEKMGAPEIDVDKFIQLANAGDDMQSALGGAAISGEAAAASLGTLTSAAAIAITAISALVAIGKKGIETYNEFATEMNRLGIIMGTTASETAGWAKIARDAGADAATMERSISFLERQITDLKLRQVEGKEASTRFSRALSALGIAWQDAEGGMRGADAVMQDIIRRTQELGPSSEAAALAASLFGRSNREILPILFQTTRSLEEAEEKARKFGLTVTANNLAAYREWKLATSDLDDATRGFWATIGKDLTPDLVSLVKVAADLVAVLKDMYIGLTALATFGRELSRTANVAAAFEAANAKARDLLGIQSELADESEDLAKAERLAAINALYEAQALEELQTKVRELQADVVRLNQEYADKRLQIEEDFTQKWADMMRDRARDTIERDMRTAWKREDLWAKHQDKLAKIANKYVGKLRELEAKRSEKVEEWVKVAHKKREDLEAKHQERLWKIQTKYLDTIEEAARKNDAVAVVRAMRDRQRALRDANRQKQTEQRDLEKDLAEKRQKIFDDYERRKADLQRQRAEEEAEAQTAYAKSVADLEKRLDRERQIRQLHYKWEEQDLYETRQRQMNELLQWYAEERNALERHLAELGATATTGILAAGNEIAAATAQAITTISAAAEAALWSGRHARGVYGQDGDRGEDRYGRNVGWGRSPFRRAEGGLDVVSKPTAFLAGEAGPEALLSMPLSGTMNVNHQFSPLPVNVGGIPNGMSTEGIQALLWNAMAGVAEQLLAEVGR